MKPASVAAVLLLAGCASRAVNTLPEAHVAEIVTVPEHAMLDVDCAGHRLLHQPAPLRVNVPEYGAGCTMTVSSDGFRPLTMRFDSASVMRDGEPLRVEERHDLSRAATEADIVLFPLQMLGDRIQNAVMRKARADYRVVIKLFPAL
jgi:hypothetical protein